MTDLIGKRFRINGKYVGDKFAWREGKIQFVHNDHSCDVVMDTGELLGVPLEWLDIIEEEAAWQSPQDSLTELQKLCTTNNIHILISKESSEGSYQIWDGHSDDTYEMNNVDDVMKAIECLNELKQWRQ